jgi:membrane protease subunit HflK
MHHNPGSRDHEDDGLAFEAMDAPNQSLADALRVSFRILKVVLIVVIVLYFISGVQKLEQNEKALVLRLGKIQDRVEGPGGAVWTFPRPIDQLIKVPVAEKRTITLHRQDLHVKEGEDRSAVRRTGGLDPKLDGSIMTGDRGLVHAQWIVTYEIDDLKKFYINVFDAEKEGEKAGEKSLIRLAVENAAIEVIGQMAAVDVVRNEISQIQERVQSKAQATLNALETGIKIANIDAKPSWPVQTKAAFEMVTNASSDKRKKKDDAQKRSREILNGTAGPAHITLKKLFDEYLAAKRTNDGAVADLKMAEIENVILHQATGEASQTIQEARSFKKMALEDVQADALEFRALLPEYKRNPEVLLSRLWYEAQDEILGNPNITKRHLPAHQKDVRLIIGPDPIEKAEREKRELEQNKKAKGDFSDVEQRSRRSGMSPSRMKRQLR